MDTTLRQALLVSMLLFLFNDFGISVYTFENRLKPLYVTNPFYARIYVFWKLIKKDYIKLIPLLLASIALTYSKIWTLEITLSMLGFWLYTSLFYWYRSSMWSYWGLASLFVISIWLNISFVRIGFPFVLLLSYVLYLYHGRVTYYTQYRWRVLFNYVGDVLTFVSWIALFLMMGKIPGTQQLPLEQLLVFAVMGYVAIIEVNYTENVLRLNQYRAKFFVNLTRNSYPTLNFLSETQLNRLKSASWLWLSIIVGLMLD